MTAPPLDTILGCTVHKGPFYSVNVTKMTIAKLIICQNHSG